MVRRRTAQHQDTQPSLQVPDGRSTVSVKDQEAYLPGFLGKFSDYLFRISTLQIFLGALMLVGVLGRQISGSAKDLEQYTSLPILTYRISYSPQAVQDLFDTLEEEGRKAYKGVNAQSTLFFPLAVALALIVSLGRVSDAAGFGHAWNLFPLIIVAVATVENVLIGIMLQQYPDQSNVLATICGLAAALKWRLLMYSAFAAIVGVGWIIARSVKQTLRL